MPERSTWGKALDVPDPTLTGSPTISGPGTIDFNGTVEVPGSLTLTGNWTLTGALAGPGTLTIPAGSQAVLGQGSGLVGAAHLLNKGSFEAQMDACGNGDEGLVGGSVLENAASLSLDDNTAITSCDGNGGNEVLNDAGATLTYDGSSSTAAAGINAPFTDTGTVSVGQGTLNLTSLSNLSSGVLSGGAYVVKGVLSLPSAITKTPPL